MSIFRTLIIGLLCFSASAADQPQWGERFTRNMVSAEKGLPDSFDPTTRKNIKWVAELGDETHGSPAIAAGRVFIGTNNGQPRDLRHKGDRGVMMCLDEKDGHFIWQLVVPKVGGDPYLDWPHGGIVSPATIEGDRVYTLTNRGEVVCLNINGMANGNTGPYQDEARHATPASLPPVELGPTDADIIWLFDLVTQAGIYRHDAAHSSVLIDGDLLYINSCNGVDNTHRRIRKPDAPSLIVLDKKTGRLVAADQEHIGPRIFHCTWSSPALGIVSGRRLIFFGGDDGVIYAFEAMAGPTPEGQVASLKKVWSFDCDPTAPKEDVHRWTANRRESPSVIMGMPVFDSGRIYVAAGGDIWWGKRQGALKCIDAGKSGDVTKTGEVWSYAMKQGCCTPAVYNGLVFATDCGGQVHCIDAKTGQGCWVHPMEGEIWASPLVADGKVYVGTRRGMFVVLAAERQKRLLSSIDLDSPISATATAANGVVYVATQSKLLALSEGGK